MGRCERYLGLETILKRDFCNMNPKSPEDLIKNKKMAKSQHIISLQMLLILLKKVIIECRGLTL